MQSEASDPVWGPGIVPIILRNLCPGCQRLRLDTETEVFYPTDFKPEGLGHMAEGWCNGIGCMPDEQGVPACAADQVGPRGEDGPTGPCGGPIGPCGPDCVRFVTVSDLPAGQPNKNEDIISPDAIVGTPLSQPNAIQALWDKSKVSTPVDHVGIRGISLTGRLLHSPPSFTSAGKDYTPLLRPVLEENYTPSLRPVLEEDKGGSKPLFAVDYAGVELRAGQHTLSGLDENAKVVVPLEGADLTATPVKGFSSLPDKLFIEPKRDGFFTPEFEKDLKEGMYDSRWVTEVLMRDDKFSELPQVDRILLLFAATKWYPKPANLGHRGPLGPCGPTGDGIDECNGDCRKFLELQPDYETATSLSCREIKRFRFFYRQLEAFDFVFQEAKTAAATEGVLMPRELTAENGAKALLSGEFYEEVEVPNPEYDPEFDEGDDDDEEYEQEPATYTKRVPVTWDTIKKIYKMCVAHFTQANPGGNQAGN